jgi:hypothetical protein
MTEAVVVVIGIRASGLCRLYLEPRVRLSSFVGGWQHRRDSQEARKGHSGPDKVLMRNGPSLWDQLQARSVGPVEVRVPPRGTISYSNCPVAPWSRSRVENVLLFYQTHVIFYEERKRLGQ